MVWNVKLIIIKKHDDDADCGRPADWQTSRPDGRAPEERRNQKKATVLLYYQVLIS